jgi:hypothetical protein
MGGPLLVEIQLGKLYIPPILKLKLYDLTPYKIYI